jgi:hypothetical protein
VQWVALQSIAWTAMIVDNAKSVSLCHAIARTFDGAHPCSLCHIVNKAKATEKKSDLQPLTPKIDMICTRGGVVMTRPFSDVEYLSCEFSLSETWHSPPVPPPRNSFVA